MALLSCMGKWNMTIKSCWYKRGGVYLLLWLMAQVATAQIAPDAQKRYNTAVRLVQAGDYERAKTDLNAIILQRGPLAPYASYYYALAAFRQKNISQARLMLLQLMEVFPDWRKMDEARYLLAASYMELGQYEEALKVSQLVSDSRLLPLLSKLEQHFIPRITDLDQLKKLNKAYPSNRTIGLTLIELIQRKSSDKDDLELSDRLTNRFGVPGVATATTQATASAAGAPSRPSMPPTVPARTNRPKGYYNVAVMFPFRLDGFENDKRGRSNQYAYDLYNGIKMAKAKLQEEGITVNLFAYDLDNDPNRALEVVNSPAFAQTDLIIGPLYVEPNRIASAYANQNGILLLNPMATSSELVMNQPMSYLAQPSLNQQARKAAEQAGKLGGSRKVAIYFGTSRKDSLLAQAYLDEIRQQRYQVVDFKKVSGNAQSMADAMFLTAPGSKTLLVSSTTPAVPSSLGHIFFASSNENDGVRMLDALSRRKVTGPLIATASAFDFYRNSANTFTRRDLYLVYPDFIDTSREPVVEFEEQYLEKRHTIPSVFASEGYDMMLFFGRQLARNGLQPGNHAALRSDTDDYLLSGFDYTQSNENQVVPIVKYEDGRLVKIN